ncbi:MAG: hypothetical protein WC547_06695, partial [Candidatus Omnitrophota bacterium]
LGLAFSMVREPAEIDDAMWLLKLAGISDLKTGIEVDGPNLIYAYDYYLAPERGIDFLFMDRDSMRAMAAAKRGTEWNNTNLELITEEDVDKSLKDVTIPVTVTAAAKNGIPLYYNNKNTDAVALRSSGAGEDAVSVKLGLIPAAVPLVVNTGTSHGNIIGDVHGTVDIKSIGGGAAVFGGFTAASRMQKYTTIQLIEAAAKIKASSAAVYQKLVTGFGNFVTALRDVKVGDEQVGVVVMGANAVLDNAGTFESLKQVKGAQHALKAVVWGEKPATDQEAMDLTSALTATSITKEAAVMLDSMENVLERIGEEYNIGQSKIMLMLSEKDVAALEKEFDMTIAEFLDRNVLLKATIIKDSASGEAAPMTLAFANLLARNLKVEAPALGSALARLTAMTYKDASTDVIAAVTDLTANLVTIMPVNVDAETAQAAQDYKDATAAARKLDIGV